MHNTTETTNTFIDARTRIRRERIGIARRAPSGSTRVIYAAAVTTMIAVAGVSAVRAQTSPWDFSTAAASESGATTKTTPAQSERSAKKTSADKRAPRSSAGESAWDFSSTSPTAAAKPAATTPATPVAATTATATATTTTTTTPRAA